MANNPLKVPTVPARYFIDQLSRVNARDMRAEYNELMMAMQIMSVKSPWLGYDEVEAPKPKPAIEPSIIDKLIAAEPRKILARVPDKMEVITGWRAWRLGKNKNDMRLQALGQNDVWPVKKALQARCAHGNGHPAPHNDCECGVWAFHSLDTLLSALANYKDVKIVGKVSLWGRVWECERGWRAEFAYPSELWLTDESLEQLGYIYGVPVRTP